MKLRTCYSCHVLLWSGVQSLSTNGGKVQQKEILRVGKEVGNGSYGTVHLCDLQASSDSDTVIGKRAWGISDLQERDEGQQNGSVTVRDKKFYKDKAVRCAKFLDVEKHCFSKMQNLRANGEMSMSPWQLPELIGCFVDDNNDEWATFSLIEARSKNVNEPSTSAAITLSDAINEQWQNIHSENPDLNSHRLSVVQRELGLSDEIGFEETLDHIFESMLTVLYHVHSADIVHRDIKPQNFLLDPSTKSLVLIDFGSACDLQPTSSFSLMGALGITGGGRVGLELDSVCVSPIYCAPEIFIKLNESPKNFDVFSCAMVFTQILFSLFDQRTDAAFRQQLVESEFNLDVWLSRELSATLRPAGIDEALSYLGERPGLWTLLSDLLQQESTRRPTSAQALVEFQQILRDKGLDKVDRSKDSEFFVSVVDASEDCDVELDKAQTSHEMRTEFDPRPLHYVATFDKSQPLGLILAEAEEVDENDFEDKLNLQSWERETANSRQGEVFVKDLVEDGQAEELGIFKVGDKLVGVGDLAFGCEGFEKAVSLIQSQPAKTKTISLHFSRRPSSTTIFPSNTDDSYVMEIIDQGVWSVSGRRKTQEDRFLLHEYHESEKGHFLMAGIYDGHGGDAASTTVSRYLPGKVREYLFDGIPESDLSPERLKQSLEQSWDEICEMYRMGCDGDDTCSADYDEIEGIIKAGTGSKDLVAGTTATSILMPYDNASHLIVLNCGDSRTLCVGEPCAPSDHLPSPFSKSSYVHFATRDHSPKDKLEKERLKRGRKEGLDYSLPECSIKKWFLQIGDYQYAVSRSLEGSFATSKGIVSNADMTTLCLKSLRSERKDASIILASDGLFEVIDNELVAKIVTSSRNEGLTANEVTKRLCNEAIRKGSSDNISVIVIYLKAHE